MNMILKNSRKYFLVLVITLGIFLSVFLLVDAINTKKRKQITDLQNKITVDLIANETQFDLLKNAPCKAVGDSSILSKQLGELGEKLAFAEQTQGEDNDAVIELKKYYSLLQVKDYLLSQEVAKKCDIQIESLVYLYGRDCDECRKQGIVLTEMKKKYPWLRIYSFDLDLDFSIVETFTGLYDITSSDEAPIIIVGDKKYAGFSSLEEVSSYIPELEKKKKEQVFVQKALDFINEKYDLDYSKEDLENIEYFNFVEFKRGSEEDGDFVLDRINYQEDKEEFIELVV